jgi:hypothetical protein
MRILMVIAFATQAGVVRAEPEAPTPAQDLPAQDPQAQDPPVPAARRLSPRNDMIAASYATTHTDEVTTRDFRLRVAAPLVRGDGYGGALMLGYGATHLEIGLDQLDEEIALHRFEAGFAGGGGLAPGWSLRAALTAAYSSDLQQATWSAVQGTAAVMVQHVLGPSDALVIGAAYSSVGELYPVLPILGYVHQRVGSPLRLDVFLPRYARVEYALSALLTGAIGLETSGNTWIVEGPRGEVQAKRAGGAAFGALQVAATRLLRFEARLGVSVERETLPVTSSAAMGPMATMTTIDQPLHAAAFAQLLLSVVP